jgi:hypothetical protein
VPTLTDQGFDAAFGRFTERANRFALPLRTRNRSVRQRFSKQLKGKY